MVNTAASLGGGRAGGVLPLASLNHISIVCRSVEESLRFYTDVLGFAPIRRPGSFDFDGAWCVSSYLGGGNGPRPWWSFHNPPNSKLYKIKIRCF